MKLQDYRESLRSEFLKRTQSRSQYSLRAFARDLAVSPSRLSDLLGLKTHLSVRTAQKVVSRLSFSEAEKQKWLTQVEMVASRSPTRRKAAADKLKVLTHKSAPKKIGNSEFSLLSDWYMLAILELAADGRLDANDAKWAAALDLTLFVYRQAIKRMVQAQFIELKGDRYVTVDRSFLAGDQGPSADVRTFHSQLLQLAIGKLMRSPPASRDFNARYVSLTKEQYEEMKKRIRDFLGEVMEQGGRERKDTDVYAVSIQLFPLTQMGERK